MLLLFFVQEIRIVILNIMCYNAQIIRNNALENAPLCTIHNLGSHITISYDIVGREFVIFVLPSRFPVK